MGTHDAPLGPVRYLAVTFKCDRLGFRAADLTGGPDDRGAHAEGMARSRRIVDQRWPEIERIARALYARGQLNAARREVAAKAS